MECYPKLALFTLKTLPQQKKHTSTGQFFRSTFQRMLLGQQFQEVLVLRAAPQKLSNGMLHGQRIPTLLVVLRLGFMQQHTIQKEPSLKMGPSKGPST
ncbi:hypothetical protein PIB30_082868 [Stylosanthes scabra]|uniref:Uncharacterized protein n=1 Tax=Stylosanthes scabra TaxID=79078 RepID=A0ABU6ZRE7_9FABA|nr:hypothetical protein [Stylosanthes scabra]